MKKATRFTAAVLCIIMCIGGALPFSAAENAPAGNTAATAITDDTNALKSTDTEPADGASSEPLIVAYYNVTQPTVDEFTNIDIINYHPATVDGAANSGNTPIKQDYSSAMQVVRERARRQNPDIKFLFTLASNNTTVFESWLANASTCESLVGNIVGIVKAHGFDGVDIDYEFPTTQNLKSNFAYFMALLRLRLNNLSATTGKQYTLTMAIPATVWAFTLFDLCTIQEYIDYFNVMSYDLYVGKNIGVTHHHTPPYSNSYPNIQGGGVANDINVFEYYGIRRDKLVMGCGLYARRWTGVGSANNGLYTSGTIDDSNIHYTDLVASYINKNGYVRYWDDNAKAPWLYNAEQHVFLSYDDPASVQYKCDIVAGSGVRGIMVFDYCTCDGIGLFNYMRYWLNTSVHTHNYLVQTTATPTCQSEGSSLSICVGCGDTVVKTLPKSGHSFGEATVTPATCTADGKSSAVCTVCREAVETVIPATGHSFGEWESDIPSSCTEAGVRTRTCTVCGEKETKNTPAGEHSFGGWTTETPATCTADGVSARTCASCAVKETETIPATGHSWGGWTLTRPASAALEGEESRTCSLCSETQSRPVAYVPPAESAPEAAVDNYTVSITNITGANYIRLASGEHTALATIRTAPDLVQLGGTYIASHTADGVFSYTLAKSGVHTFWIRYDSGAEYLVRVDASDITPVVSVDALTLKIVGLEEIYDCFVSSGTLATYRECSNNRVSRTTAASLGGGNSYSCTLPANGDYTVCIRYADPAKPTAFLYASAEVPMPTVATDGPLLRVGGLEGIRVIRVAPGEWATPGEVKRAPGCLNYTGKRIPADPCSIRCAPGKYTVVVQYYNGLTVTRSVEIVKKVPAVQTAGSTLTLGSLDDLYIIRWAPGTFASSGEVKRAPGSRYLRPSAVKDGTAVITGLHGDYSVLVQYNDGSVNVLNLSFPQD